MVVLILLLWITAGDIVNNPHDMVLFWVLFIVLLTLYVLALLVMPSALE